MPSGLPNQLTLRTGQVVNVTWVQMQSEDGTLRFYLPVLPAEVYSRETFNAVLEQTLDMSLEQFEKRTGWSFESLYLSSTYAATLKTLARDQGITEEQILASEEWQKYAIDTAKQIATPQRFAPPPAPVTRPPDVRAPIEEREVSGFIELPERLRRIEEATGRPIPEQYWEDVEETRRLAEADVSDPLQYPQRMRTSLGWWPGMPPSGTKRTFPVSPEGRIEPPSEGWEEVTPSGVGYTLRGLENWSEGQSHG